MSNNSKLQLKRETLIQLSGNDLEQANGGTSVSIITKVPTNVWAGAAGAAAAGAKWANDHLPKKKANGGYKPYGY